MSTIYDVKSKKTENQSHNSEISKMVKKSKRNSKRC